MIQILMRKHKVLMTQKFFSMLLGGTLTMMIVSVLLMSDSVIAGVFISTDAVAGITLVTPIYSLSAFLGSVFALGIPIVYSSEMGKFNKQEADRVFGLGLLMSIIAGVLLFLLITLFGDMYIQSETHTAAILNEALGYLYWMKFTILLLPIQMLISAVVYADGDEILSTIANVIQGAGNIVASICLSRLMGIKGIGLASFLFNLISLMILCIHFVKENNSLRWNLYFSSKLMKKIMRYSIIDSSSYLFLAILTAMLNIFVGKYFGGKYLVLVSAIALCREAQLIFDGIGEAITPILSVYRGEGNCIGIKSIYQVAQKTAIAEGIIVTIIMIIAAPIVPKVLDISNPQLIHITVEGVRIIALGSCFMSLLYLITSYYIVVEQITLGLIVSALRDVFLSAFFSILLGKFFGIIGMFIGLALSPAIAYFTLLIFIDYKYGRKNFPLLLDKLFGTSKSYLFNLITEPKQIITLQKKIETILKENNLDKLTTGRVKLLIEEIYMLIREKNNEQSIMSECSVFLEPEGVRIIIKDEGVLFDLTKDDVTVTSIVAYSISGYMEKMGRNKHYLTTMGFNRSSFLIKKQNG